MDFGKTRLKWHGLFFAIALVVPLGPADCRQICGQEIEARQAATVRPAAPAVAPSKLAATAVETPTNPGVRPGDSLWSYWDGQRHPGQDWAQPNYDDTSWNQGVSPLGYGDDRVKTRVSFGDDPKQRRLVVFFRHAFQLDEVSDRKLPVWGASVSFDDGIAVYVNGAEVYRNNLPDAPLKMTTRSVKAIGGAEEKKHWPFTIDAKHFTKGRNVIAVRVHQTNRTSSDLIFDLRLEPMSAADGDGIRAVAKAQQPVRQPRRPKPVATARRSFSHVSDGEVQFVDQDGTVKTRREDALANARNLVPSARLVRTMEGDTLVKLAAQYNVNLELLARLNRSGVTKVYSEPGVACVDWTHIVGSGETLRQLAKTYNTQVEVLQVMNLEVLPSGRTSIEPGMVLQVPGEFTYHYRKGGHSYLRLARYKNGAVRRSPFKAATRRTKVERVKAGQDLKAFAKANSVTVEFLRRMNNLDANVELQAGQRLLVEFSVELLEGATVEALASTFRIPVDRLLAANNLPDAAPVAAGQRLQIPIGERYRSTRSNHVDLSSDGQHAFEVVLE